MQGMRNWPQAQALLVKADDLRSLDSFLCDCFEQVEYTAHCIDDTVLSSQTIQDLLGYENRSFKRIIGLKIVASSTEHNAHLQLELEFPPNSGYKEKTV